MISQSISSCNPDINARFRLGLRESTVSPKTLFEIYSQALVLLLLLLG